MAERQPSKLHVAGSRPVSRSTILSRCHALDVRHHPRPNDRPHRPGGRRGQRRRVRPRSARHQPDGRLPGQRRRAGDAGGPDRAGDRPARPPVRARRDRDPPVGARQPARAVHLDLRPPGRPGRRRPDGADRLDPGQHPARPGAGVPGRRASPRDAALPRAVGADDGDAAPAGRRRPGHPDPGDGARRARRRAPGGPQRDRVDRAARGLRRVGPVLARRRSGRPRRAPGGRGAGLAAARWRSASSSPAASARP